MHPDSHKSTTDENGQTSPLLSSNGQQQYQPSTPSNNNNNSNNNESNNPRKDHYSYSYTYKTADPESGIPGLSSVEVNESVTEEIGPDGSKIIRRHQQEKQINKITQVVTQRVIKRQYIDPTTGQIIEYDPNNELFANLPPETVFEEHTVISDDNGGNGAPIVTTTTTSKTIPTTPNHLNSTGAAGTAKWNAQSSNIDNLQSNINSLTINEQDYMDNFERYSKQQPKTTSNVIGGNTTATASFRIKSHPEDNQGYPEERNMDYDPDDINCYPDDDLPYEGLIQTNSISSHRNGDKMKMGHLDGIRNSGGILGRSSASGGSSSSSSSPVLFGDHSMGIDMPLVSNAGINGSNFYSNKAQRASNNYQPYDNTYGHSNRSAQPNNTGTYATVVLPSSNILGTSNVRQSTNSITPVNLSSLTYKQQQQQQHQNPYYSSSSNKYDMSSNYVSKQQMTNHQQPSPSFNNSQDYDNTGLIGSGGVIGGWRNPTLSEVIDYLSHSSNEIKANAAAYLQHLCYQDDSIKAETRALGGISRLIAMLNSEYIDVYRNACGALRNLSYGKTNDENKLDIRDKCGIPALIKLLKRTHDESVKETITAVLWNLSSCEEIKEPILMDGLYALVKYIIIPYSAFDLLNSSNNPNYVNYNRSSSSLNNNNILKASNQKILSNDYSNYPTVLTNATGILRNCSSNLQFSNCYEARKKLRDCDGLIESLLRIIDQAVEPYMNENSNQRRQQQLHQQIVHLDLVVKDNMNSKCVENCMCILRNLSFRLQEIVDPNYDRDVKPIPSEEKTTKCVGGKKKKNFEEEFLNSVYPYNMPVPNEGKAQEQLWSLATLNKYLIIIKESTVRDTIEAAVGCLQNLTACYWKPSVIVRQEIRKLKGLPTLVHLLKSEEFEDEPIVSVTAIALRNAAIDSKNKELIGKYAMKDLVAKLPDPQRPMPVRLSVLNEDTITAALACINECIKSSDEFVKSCYNEGGVKRMVFITRNGQHFPIKIVKYAAHVLASMWKHKNLHDLLKKDGYKETDFTSVAKQMGLKSQSSSPANTLHRPRGDVNVKPSHHAPSSKKTKNSKANPVVQSPKTTDNVNTNRTADSMNGNKIDTPIYSQIQRPFISNTSNQSNAHNKNLIITNGTTNADSWV